MDKEAARKASAAQKAEQKAEQKARVQKLQERITFLDSAKLRELAAKRGE